MTHESEKAPEIAEAIISELDHFQHHFKPSGGALTLGGQHHILVEPCVGYAAAQRPDGSTVELFVCRNYIPFDYTPSRPSIDYASYLSPFGRIIAKKAGDGHNFAVVEAHEYKLLAKDEFR